MLEVGRKVLVTHHSRGRYVYRGHGPGRDVVCYVAEHHAVSEGGGQVLSQGHLRVAVEDRVEGESSPPGAAKLHDFKCESNRALAWRLSQHICKNRKVEGCLTEKFSL